LSLHLLLSCNTSWVWHARRTAKRTRRFTLRPGTRAVTWRGGSSRPAPTAPWRTATATRRWSSSRAAPATLALHPAVPARHYVSHSSLPSAAGLRDLVRGGMRLAAWRSAIRSTRMQTRWRCWRMRPPPASRCWSRPERRRGPAGGCVGTWWRSHARALTCLPDCQGQRRVPAHEGAVCSERACARAHACAAANASEYQPGTCGPLFGTTARWSRLFGGHAHCTTAPLGSQLTGKLRCTLQIWNLASLQQHRRLLGALWEHCRRRRSTLRMQPTGVMCMSVHGVVEQAHCIH